jgi:2-polyprenyl-3-methyl-5-hydroxy-6-metoxy-1,4-benzoquinol methylase
MMPKKIKFEAFKYRLLAEAAEMRVTTLGNGDLPWESFLDQLEFEREKGDIRIILPGPDRTTFLVEGNKAQLFRRGDDEAYAKLQEDDGLLAGEDGTKLKNAAYFKAILDQIATMAGFKIEAEQDRIKAERDFHDAWADSEDLDSIDVLGSNEVCTAPEMRYIKDSLSDLRGKRLLDVGCGLGEASVYFAMLGADVTASDLSRGMLDIASALAQKNGIRLRTHLASAEDLGFADTEVFDVIYAGNLLHHVDIDVTLSQLLPHLAENGVFVSWDPLAYNPAINVYRNMATEVRTVDEHPLKLTDLKKIRSRFQSSETRYFWLTTLIIFVVMALIQRRDPNKERYWKAILKEGQKWSWLYTPLKALDDLLLFLVPSIGLLCWNVVFIGRKANVK